MSREKNKQSGFIQHLVSRLVRHCRTPVSPKEKDSKLSAGFTIIELMIATIVFSLVLLVCLASFMQISRLFYKGVNMSRTQEVARTVLENISDDLRFARTAPNQPLNANYFCIGSHRYKFNLARQLNGTPDFSTNYGLVRETVSNGCPNPTVAGSGTNPEELLSTGMQLNKLAASCASGICTTDINVLFYGVDNQVFTSSAYPNNPTEALKDPNAQCTGSLAGSQYCATASYKSTVLLSF